MGEWTSHNRSLAKSKLQTFLNEKRKQLVSQLRANADAMVMQVDRGFSPIPPYHGGGNEQYPVWEGQMRDSTGVGLYVEGRTEYFMPAPKARNTQFSDNYGNDIVGHELLNESITQGAATHPYGVWLVLYSSVPYAEQVNRVGSPWFRGIGYFDTLKRSLTESIQMIVSTLE